jgi:hypothetical protein
MKKLSLIILCVSLLTSENGFSQFQEKLTNTQFNKLLTVFKGRRSDFGSYYFNNFPCTQCSNGYFYIKEGNSLESSYSYKGISFKGILKSPQLNYEEKADKLNLTSSWFNTGSNGGYKSAYISFEYSFRSDFNNWNTILRFISGNTEMVAYYNLTRKQLDDIYSFVLNDTKYKEYLLEIETKKLIERRKIFIQDSLKIIEENIKVSLNKERFKKEFIAKQALDLEMAIARRIKDSIDKIIDDSVRFNLKVLDVYKDAIVVKVDGQGHGLLISKLKYVIRDNSSWENTKSRMFNELTNNGWELPMKGSDEIDFFRKNYKNEEFRIKFKGSKTNEFFRLCMDSKIWDVMAFLVGEKPKEEDYSKLYFFGVKTY